MWCRGCLSVVVLVVIVGLTAGWMVARNLGRFLDVSQDVGTVDAIVVMGGEGGRFKRTQHAIDLYEAGVAPIVVFSGGTLLGAGLACSSTEMSLDAADKLGLPADAVLISGEAQSTYDEADNIAQIAQENDWQSLALVTDSFHTRRSVQTLQSTMPGLLIVASAPDDPRFDADRWWESEQGLVFAINEALKLAYYWKEYGIQPLG
jgi:uncharacterized SAM-binding protein YcdF (DUF218 family)